MNRLSIALLILVPLAAHADRDYTRGKGSTWDCAKDPTVNINHGNGKYTLKGACETINVNGGSNTLVIDQVDTLNVNGAKNVVTVRAIDTLNVVGAKNKITWKTAKSGDAPTQNVAGVGNSITKAK